MNGQKTSPPASLPMKTATSISGGKSSAYMAAHYPTDYMIFALVRIDDARCQFPDKAIRRLVEDRIGKPFIATAEDDIIIYTMLDLEQHIGQEITWVSGETFDRVIQHEGRILPSWRRRFCTEHLKIKPIFEWLQSNVGSPVKMNIGYRANEGKRVSKMLRRCNAAGIIEYKACTGTHESGPHKGKRRWENIPYQMPAFPLYSNQIFPAQIHNYWEFRPVRFAPRNNCVGCFHRNEMLLKKMAMYAPEKMRWFSDQEKKGKGTWRTGITYDKIISHQLQAELDFSDFSECDSGYCGI